MRFLLPCLAIVACASPADRPSDSSAPAPDGPWAAVAVQTLTRDLDGGDGLVLTADGQLRVGEPAWDRIQTLDPDSGALELFVDGLGEPYGLASRADGALLVANWAAQNALSIDPSGAQQELASTTDRFGNVYVDPTDGSVYLPNFYSGLLERLDASDTRQTVSSGQAGDGLHAVMHDDQHRLYTGYVLTGEIYRHGADGTPSLWATLPGRLGNLLWFDGRMLATGWDTHQVFSIDEDGSVAAFAGTGRAGQRDGTALEAKFENPNGLVHDPVRQVLYVSESVGRVRVITLERTTTG